MTVELVGDETSGLASLLADLLRQNLARSPDLRARLRRPSTVAIEAVDAEVGVTLRIDRGTVRVEPFADPSADVSIRGSSEALLVLTAAPLRWGVPDVLDPRGRRALVALVRRRVRVRGLFTRLGQVVDAVRLLSAA